MARFWITMHIFSAQTRKMLKWKKTYLTDSVKSINIFKYEFWIGWLGCGLKSTYVTESKTVLDPRFHATDSGFRVLESSLDSGTWILDSSCYWDSGFLKPYFRFQSPRFRIPQAKIFSDSGILGLDKPYLLDVSGICFSVTVSTIYCFILN